MNVLPNGESWIDFPLASSKRHCATNRCSKAPPSKRKRNIAPANLHDLSENSLVRLLDSRLGGLTTAPWAARLAILNGV